MSYKKNTLTDDAIQEVIDAINEENKDNKPIHDMQSASKMSTEELLTAIDDKEDDKKVGISVDPTTGQIQGTSVLSGYGVDSKNTLYDDFLFDDDELKPADEADTDIPLHMVKKAVDDNDSTATLNIKQSHIDTIRRLIIKKNQGFEVKYNELPDPIKEMIDQTVKAQFGGLVTNQVKKARNVVANSIIDEIYTGVIQEKISEVCVDMNTSIKNLAKEELVPGISEQRKMCVSTFVYKFPQMAEECKESDPKKAELLLSVSEGYKQAHTLEDMYNAYIKGGKRVKIRKIDIEKLNKVIANFNTKYETSNLVVRDISPAADILARHVNKRISMTAIKGFIALFCKYTETMNPKNIGEHTFMYYFIDNILILDVPFTDEADIQFRDDYIKTVNKFLVAIEERLSM